MFEFLKNEQVNKLAKKIEKLTLEVAALRAEKEAFTEQRGLEKKTVSLKKQVSDLEISRDKKQEDFDRRERELTHMIGLEKKRQEVEIKQASKDARLSVREDNLKSEQDRFEKQMKFSAKQFDGQVDYLQDLMSQILKRLPTINIDNNLGSSMGDLDG